MKIIATCLTVSALIISSIKAASSPYLYIASITENGMLSPTEKRERIDIYLRSLSQPVFMSFLYELSCRNEYTENHPDIGVIMGLYAHSYLRGPGQNVPIVENVKLVIDPKLVYWWKIALLGVLHLDDLELMDIETTNQITQLLCWCATDNNNPELLRSVCLKRLNSYLQTQEEHILVKHPQLRPVFESKNNEMVKEDAELSKADVEFVKGYFQAVSIYNTAVRSALKELKDTRGIKER